MLEVSDVQMLEVSDVQMFEACIETQAGLQIHCQNNWTLALELFCPHRRMG
jgi:hypothetical protein